jgi:2-amino-4-hydroxy-6-hydroxymethyldihydropteridine diphosphokinase
MPRCLIGLGSNQGDRQQMLDQAVACLAGHPQLLLCGKSAWHESRPIGGPPGQPQFLNGAAVVETALPPQAVLEALKRIETNLGRRLGEHWGPRPIDLDLLLYGRTVLRMPGLVLPHPRMAWRRFVLQPAAEVARSMIHPTTGWTIGRLLDHLDRAAPYVAITGPIGAGKTQLARRLARQTSARLIAEPLDLDRLEAFYADPAGQGWDVEIELLQGRVRLLAADLPEWSGNERLAVSDFWFDQSLAFARVWLPPDRLKAFRRRWERLRHEVVRPKLLVLLDAPAEQLWQRVVRRGRRGERDLSQQQLEQIRRSVLAQATQPHQGPVLQLVSDDFEEVFGEVLAAVEAME